MPFPLGNVAKTTKTQNPNLQEFASLKLKSMTEFPSSVSVLSSSHSALSRETQNGEAISGKNFREEKCCSCTSEGIKKKYGSGSELEMCVEQKARDLSCLLSPDCLVFAFPSVFV